KSLGPLALVQIVAVEHLSNIGLLDNTTFRLPPRNPWLWRPRYRQHWTCRCCHVRHSNNGKRSSKLAAKNEHLNGTKGLAVIDFKAVLEFFEEHARRGISLIENWILDGILAIALERSKH